jgi:glyoxylase-like metal-dependent hydrolase (beta-lactamase superfamily II)
MSIRCIVITAAFLASALIAGPAGAGVPPSVPPTAVPGLTFKLAAVVPGVHVAVAEGVPYYVANSVVIVGDDGVLLVDSSAGPGEAQVLREAIRTITTKPVRYIVDTHFHFDHALGHAAFPEAVTIAHVATRAGLALGLKQPTLAANLAALPGRAADMRARAAAETDAAKRDGLLADATKTEAYARELAAVVASPSQITFTDQLTLWLGTREVRIMHLGRGHTAGDTVVYLPAERVICTGDLFNGYIGYMGDAYVDEWADTLGHLGRIDFRTVIAGHGWPFDGKQSIEPVEDCLRDLWRQAAQFKRDGVPAKDAAPRIDLRAHASSFPQLAKVGFGQPAIERIYSVIDERAASPR